MFAGGAQAHQIEAMRRRASETLTGIVATASLSPAPSNRPEDLALHTRMGEVQGIHIRVKVIATFTGDDDATVSLSTPDDSLEKEMKRVMADLGYVLEERMTCKGDEVGGISQQVFWRYYFRHTNLSIVRSIRQFIPKGVTP